MTAQSPKPPKGEQFVKLFRDLLKGDSWRSQSINTRRFVDFIMAEHLAHGGQENGMLKAPYEQLEEFGIGARHIASAIRQAKDLGLVDCHRGGKRVASTYALTWLPLHDGSPATHRWRTYRNGKLNTPGVSKTKKLPPEGKAALPSERKAEGAKLPHEGKVDSPKMLPSEGEALYRRSYQGGMFSSVLEGEGCILLDSIAVSDEAVSRHALGEPDVSDALPGKKIRVVI